MKKSFLSLPIVLLALCLLLILPAQGAEAERQISQDHMILYGGEIVTFNWVLTDDVRPQLLIEEDGQPCSGVQWRSDNDALISVDEDGYITWSNFGAATITGTLDGQSYTCQVEVRELRFYHLWVYTSEYAKNQWVWDRTVAMAEGQTATYRLEEWVYDRHGAVVNKLDMTYTYYLHPNAPDCLDITPGKITALKPDTSQEDGTAQVYGAIPNDTIQPVQRIWINVFTQSLDDQIPGLCIKPLEVRNQYIDYTGYILTTSVNIGYFPLDDSMFIRSSDWTMARIEPEDLVWKSSNDQILRLTGRQDGSMPEFDSGLMAYSIVEAQAVGSGKVTLSVWYQDKELLASTVLDITNVSETEEPAEIPTPEPTVEPTTAPGEPTDTTTPGEPIPTDNLTPTVGALKYKLSGSNATVTGPKSKNATKLTIPATIQTNGKTYKVTAIKASAFKGMKKLTTVSIGKNVKTIGKNAFASCVKLKKVTGGAALTTIGEAAFKGDKVLATITLPKNVKSIGKNAFNSCAKLKTITIKTTKLTTKAVGANAFKGIYKKATFKVPKAKKSAYKTLVTKKGAPKTVKFQ